MPLWLALIFGLAGSLGLTLGVASIAGEGAPQVLAYFTVAVLPSAGIPFLARYKRRSLLRWGGFAAFIFLISLSPFAGLSNPFTFLAMMIILALGFSVRNEVKIPEEELEADEDPAPLQALVSIREDSAVLHASVEELYLARDYAAMVGQRESLEAIPARIEPLPPQVAERAARVRLHIHAGVMQLIRATESADFVGTAVRDDPSLLRVANGDDSNLKGKAQKAVYKQVREIEILLDKSRIQLGVAKGLLEALGFTPAQPQPRPWMPPQAILPPADAPTGVPIAAPSVSKPRPARRQRRSRF